MQLLTLSQGDLFSLTCPREKAVCVCVSMELLASRAMSHVPCMLSPGVITYLCEVVSDHYMTPVYSCLFSPGDNFHEEDQLDDIIRVTSASLLRCETFTVCE